MSIMKSIRIKILIVTVILIIVVIGIFAIEYKEEKEMHQAWKDEANKISIECQ